MKTAAPNPPMSTLFRAVQVSGLLGALFLSACSSPSTTREMYKGERKGPVLTKQQPAKAVISEKRMSAIKAFGLDDHHARPKHLVGLSDVDVTNTLGRPSFVRKDKGVEIWQYRSDDCILDLFLYHDKDKDLSVDHTELRGPHLDSAGELSCFSKIVMGKS